MEIDPTTVCPCGSQSSYATCCAPIHAAPARASTPEALMRARFSAFVLADSDFLIASWAPDTRPMRAELEGSGEDSGPRWRRLIVAASENDDDHGWVRFRALAQQADGWLALEETSRFRRIDGQWFYLDGDADWQRLRVGRNAPCPCGSGLKAKRCCARG